MSGVPCPSELRVLYEISQPINLASGDIDCTCTQSGTENKPTTIGTIIIRSAETVIYTKCIYIVMKGDLQTEIRHIFYRNH